MVLYEIHREDGGNGITFVHMLYITVARGTELPPLFLLSVYIFIFNKMSLLFHLFFLVLTCWRSYSYNLMLTAICMCRPYTNNPLNFPIEARNKMKQSLPSFNSIGSPFSFLGHRRFLSVAFVY